MIQRDRVGTRPMITRDKQPLLLFNLVYSAYFTTALSHCDGFPLCLCFPLCIQKQQLMIHKNKKSHKCSFSSDCIMESTHLSPWPCSTPRSLATGMPGLQMNSTVQPLHPSSHPLLCPAPLHSTARGCDVLTLHLFIHSGESSTRRVHTHTHTPTFE